MRIGICDYCDQRRYIREGKDLFDVHVVDLCAYGCKDERSIPLNEDCQGIFARCENCESVLKPEKTIEYIETFNEVFCNKYCVADFYHYDDIEFVNSTSLDCKKLTKKELEKYRLKIEDERLLKLERLETKIKI